MMQLQQWPFNSSASPSLPDAQLLDADIESLRNAGDHRAELLLVRDVTLYLYLLVSCQRGGEGARLRPVDLHPRPASWDVHGLPPLITVTPNGTKTAQRRRAGRILLRPNVTSPRHCFAARLQQYLDRRLELGCPCKLALLGR